MIFAAKKKIYSNILSINKPQAMQKILIVEDEKAISGVLHNILSDELTDYEFVIAED